MVSSAATKLDGQIRSSIDATNANTYNRTELINRTDHAQEVLRLEQQLRSLEQTHAALIVETDEKVTLLETELASANAGAGLGGTAEFSTVSNAESEETSIHYVTKIQSQQSELEKLRAEVEKQRDELKMARQELAQEANSTLQQDLLRLKNENYDLQTQLQRAQGGAKASGAGQDRSTWSYVPKIPNNLANMVTSAATKLDVQIRSSIDATNVNINRTEHINRTDHAEEVLRLEQHLRSLEQAHAALIIESDEKVTLLQTELARATGAGLGATASSNVSNPESEETSMHYLAKIQSQQSELDNLRDVVEKQQEELKMARQELEQDANLKLQREPTKFSILKRSSGADRRSDESEQMINIEKKLTSTLKDEKAALESQQQALEARLNEALTESKQSFAMKCMIQSMGKKIKDVEQLLSQQKERSTRTLQETNTRWERERLPMATEDAWSKFSNSAALRSGYGGAVGSTWVPTTNEAQINGGSAPNIDDGWHGKEGEGFMMLNGHGNEVLNESGNMDFADIRSKNLPPHDVSEQGKRTGEHRKMDVDNIIHQQMEGMQKELDEYRAEVEKLREKVSDLEVEKGIIERRAEERVADLKTLLLKKVVEDKKRAILSPPISPRATTVLDRFVIHSNEEETVDRGTPTYSSLSPTQESSKPPKEEAAIGDALYQLKISELETLCEGLRKDLEISQQSEAVLKEDIRHKRQLITHVLKKMATTATPNDVEDLFGNKAPRSGNDPGGFTAGSKKATTPAFFQTFFPEPEKDDTTELENALEGCMADNMRLRDNIRVLGDQIRYYLTKEAEGER